MCNSAAFEPQKLWRGNCAKPRLIARVKPLLVLLHGAAYAKVCGQAFDAASFQQAGWDKAFHGKRCERYMVAGHSWSMILIGRTTVGKMFHQKE